MEYAEYVTLHLHTMVATVSVIMATMAIEINVTNVMPHVASALGQLPTSVSPVLISLISLLRATVVRAHVPLASI